MRIYFQKKILREDVQNNKHLLYIFGDNLARVGLGGQAAAMRGEPNSAGIATKRAPGMSADDFFSDKPDEIGTVINDILRILDPANTVQYSGIVYPLDGVGTGLAEMPKRSPRAYQIVTLFELGLSLHV